MSDSFDKYQSPLSGRYSSPEMGLIFSEKIKFITYRSIWLELAKAEKSLGLSIPDKAIDQMQDNLNNLNPERVFELEKETKHDIMAHIHAFGELCPDAAPFIHLGATSCLITDNADLILLKRALKLVCSKLKSTVNQLAQFAATYKDTACVSYTHFQIAQPTTVGKRACLWLQDFFIDLQEIERHIENIPFLGAKGATGSQSSFLRLFNQDHEKVKSLDQKLCHAFGFSKLLTISGQTYTRKLDILILNLLESFAASAHKFATDIRLLSHMGELKEAKTDKQVGSSAMPHKENPIFSERVCGLSRYLISLSQNSSYTTATQWLERSLDDSSNRRLTIPQAFLTTDAILNLIHHILSRLTPDLSRIEENLEREKPKLVLENILMHAALNGQSRQKIHEKLRTLSKHQDFLQELVKDKELGLNEATIQDLMKSKNMIGRSSEQTTEFLEEINAYLNQNKQEQADFASIQV